MVLKIADRVKQRTNSTGTAGISLIGSIDGFQTFSSVLSSGDTTYYVIEEANKFEVGLGTFTSGSLERTKVFASSNSGSKISLGGSGIVSLTYPADRAVYINQDLHSVISSGLLFSNNDQLVSTSGSLFYNSTNLLTGSQAYSSGIATYASGQAIENEADIVTASGALRAGITSNTTLVTYASGQAIANEADIATNVSNISYVSGNAAYASGQSITNESDIVASSGIANYASGQAISNQSNIVASSGIANYASGQAITNKSNIATNTSNIATNSAGITYVSGIAVYASGQAIENESDILSLIGASGTATSLIATSGIATYASGRAVENEAGVLYNSGIATYASGIAAGQAANVAYVSGVAIDVSGVAYYASGLLSDGSPSGVAFYGGDGVLRTSTYLVYNNTHARLGIGMNPTDKLDVKGTIGSSGNGYKLEGKSIAKWDGSKLQLGDWNSEGYPVTIYAASNQRIVMDGDGNVGINQENPDAQLDVYNDTSSKMAMRITAAAGQSANLFEWQDSAGSMIAALTSVGVFENINGVKIYASGLGTANTEFLSTTYNGADYYIESKQVGAGSYHDIYVKRENTYIKVNSTDVLVSPSLSSSGVMASGLLLHSHVPASTTNALYNEGGTLKFNGSTIGGGGGGDVTTAQLQYVSGIAVYSSGQAITNKADIVTASGALRTGVTSNTNIATYASGQVLSLGVASGLANYASGNTSNISFGSNAEGDILYHNGTKFIRLAKGTNNHILKMDGNVPNWEAESGGGGDVTTAELQYVSGIAVYSSGQAIANESDILALQSASGIATSLLAVSGTATSLVASSGIATYSSGVLTGGNPTFGDVKVGEYIYHDGDADTFVRFGANLVNLVAGNWSAIKLEKSTGKIQLNNSNQDLDTQIMADDGEAILHADATTKSVGINTITPSYDLDIVGHDALVRSSGLIVGNSGVVLASNTPSVTTNTLYNNNGTLTFNGSSVVAPLLVASGSATYASGQSIENESDILALQSASGIATSLLVASGAANYASGNTANISFGSNAEGDILYNNGTKFIRLAKGTDNHVLTMDGNVPNWEAAAGGSPGGSDTQIQFNDSSSFGGDGDLTWNKTTNVLTINGTLMAGIKSFVIDHPTKEGMKLQYSCLEGPENGVYVRGTVEGNVIELPDYWVGLVDENSITVQLTAKGYSQPSLFVDRVDNNKVYLISEERINAYYTVHATRKDVEPLEVEWPK